MNFEQSIYPLTEFLSRNNFSVIRREQHFIKYSSTSVTITVAYATLEHLFYTHIGPNDKSLVELTPKIVEKVFGDKSFQYQSTLTIDDLISFLSGVGKGIVAGDERTFIEISEFSERYSEELTKQITHLQNVQSADKAWAEKDYNRFIAFFDSLDQNLLPSSYLKKYQIAIKKRHN